MTISIRDRPLEVLSVGTKSCFDLALLLPLLEPSVSYGIVVDGGWGLPDDYRHGDFLLRSCCLIRTQAALADRIYSTDSTSLMNELPLTVDEIFLGQVGF